MRRTARGTEEQTFQSSRVTNEPNATKTPKHKQIQALIEEDKRVFQNFPPEVTKIVVHSAIHADQKLELFRRKYATADFEATLKEAEQNYTIRRGAPEEYQSLLQKIERLKIKEAKSLKKQEKLSRLIESYEEENPINSPESSPDEKRRRTDPIIKN